MSKTSFCSFTKYKQTVIDIVSDLKKLKDFSGRMGLSGNASDIEDVLKRLTDDTFNVAVVGEFKRGKSTLINAMLGKDVLPTHVIPTTATLNKITYSVTPMVKIEYHDGKTEEIDVDKLNDYITKLTPESEQIAKTVKVATVYYPNNYCRNGVTIIDTPGLNDDDAMNEVTLSVLPQIDAAIMVIMAGSPFSQYEYEFLENKIIASNLGHVLFVVTCIDLYKEEEDAKKILENITGRINDAVLIKAKNVYGEDSAEYENYRRKLGSVRVYGVSAKNALKAKLKGDHAMIEQSFFPNFEKALEKFLTEDRGAIMLNVPVNRIKTSSIELANAVRLRENALAMQKDEFDDKYEKAMVEIERIRNERQAELSSIGETSERTFRDLSPIIQNYWPSLEKAADCAIDAFVISSSDVLKEPAVNGTQEAMTKAVKNALSKVGQSTAERIQDIINTSLENEAERISSFETKFFEAIENIRNLFTSVKTEKGDKGDLGAAVALQFFTGLGGVFMGYKQAGWKGMLLGGSTSLATTVAANIGAGALISALAIPVTWPVILIAAAGAAIVGTFTGKWVLGKVFLGDKTEKFKASFKEAVQKELMRMKAEDNFSENVRKQVESAFDALKTKIKTETENMLTDMQNQLSHLKVELAQAGSRNEQEKAEMEQMLKETDEICVRANELGRQLTAVFSR